MPRQADISLADFRGLGTMDVFNFEKDRPLGFSGLLVNNLKGAKLIEMTDSIDFDPRQFEELKSRQPLLTSPAHSADRADDFWKEYEKGHHIHLWLINTLRCLYECE